MPVSTWRWYQRGASAAPSLLSVATQRRPQLSLAPPAHQAPAAPQAHHWPPVLTNNDVNHHHQWVFWLRSLKSRLSVINFSDKRPNSMWTHLTSLGTHSLKCPFSIVSQQIVRAHRGPSPNIVQHRFITMSNLLNTSVGTLALVNTINNYLHTP